MEDEEILNVVLNYAEEWTDEEIGAFVRTAVTMDMTEEDILRDLGLNRRKP